MERRRLKTVRVMNQNRSPTSETGLLLRKAFEVLWTRLAANYFYRPERHYMRGPGPKSLSLIGEKLRAQTENVTQEPLPKRWLDLIHSLHEQERRRS